MYNSPTTKVLVAVSEQVFEPIQFPIVIGNEIFIVTQQDIRKIEDSRYLSFKRLNNDNNIKIENDYNNKQILDAINNVFSLREEKIATERQFIQQFHEQQLNLNVNLLRREPIQMQIDLEKEVFKKQPIIKCNTCICGKTNRPSLLHRCENGRRCCGVNTDSIWCDCKNVENTGASLSALDQLKLMKENQNTIAI